MDRFARALTAVVDLCFPPRSTELVVRELHAGDLLQHTRPQAHALDSCAAYTLLPYDEPKVGACVREAKFHGNRQAARLLALCAASYIKEELAERAAFGRRRTVLIPVPLSRARERERGYNQAERIARHIVAAVDGVEIDTKLLLRIRDTRPQTELDGEARRQNLRGAFAATRNADPRTHYLVLDDVMTTGSTLNAAVRALRAAGARHVEALALAHG